MNGSDFDFINFIFEAYCLFFKLLVVHQNKKAAFIGGYAFKYLTVA